MGNEPGGDTDEAVAQGRDHGFALTYAPAGQVALGPLDGGELLQPAGHTRGQQRAPTSTRC